MYATIKINTNVDDNKQLRPTVKSHKDDASFLSDQRCLFEFERYASLHVPAARLLVQHRATKGLMWFSSERCYFGSLEDGVGLLSQTAAVSFRLPFVNFTGRYFGSSLNGYVWM